MSNQPWDSVETIEDYTRAFFESPFHNYSPNQRGSAWGTFNIEMPEFIRKKSTDETRLNTFDKYWIERVINKS